MDKTSEKVNQASSSQGDAGHKKRMVILVCAFVIVMLTFIASIYFNFFAEKNNTQEASSLMPSEESLVSPTPFPFQEMTIPYLRNRPYSSDISEMQQIGSNANYSSYLASYNSDGFKVNGLLTVPTGVEPEGGFPAIIFIHGYIPPTIYQTTGNYADYVDYLARNGFVVYKIDLRGHAESEGEASGAYYSGDYIVDVLNAYSAFENTDFVNPEKIGLWGHSMAGNVVARSMAAKPDIPVGVIWAGAVYTYADMQELGIDDNSYRPPVNNTQRQMRREQLRQTHGDFSADSPFWQQVAVTNYLGDMQGAVQLNHAVDDDVVNIEYSRGLGKLLEESSVEYELHEYPSGGHNLVGGSFGLAMQNTVNFFNTHLKSTTP